MNDLKAFHRPPAMDPTLKITMYFPASEPLSLSLSLSHYLSLHCFCHSRLFCITVKMSCCINNLLKTQSTEHSEYYHSISDAHLRYKHIEMFGIYPTPLFIIHYNKCKREEQKDQSCKTDNGGWRPW